MLMFFFRGRTCPIPHSIGEGLSRRYVGATLLAVDFPVGGEVCGGCVILGDVKRGAARYIVTPISGTHVVAGSRSESARGSGESVSGVEVHSLAEVPTDVNGSTYVSAKPEPPPPVVRLVPVMLATNSPLA